MTRGFTVAIIKQNKFKFSDGDMNDNKLTDDILENILEDYTEFKNVTDVEDMMVFICDVLKMTDKIFGDTSTCYEDDEYIYQICHLSSFTDKQKNYIATKMTNDSSSVIGDAVIFKAKINNDKTCTNVDITMKDIINLYRRSHKHIGLVVHPDGKTDEITYFFHPIDSMKSDVANNLKYHEFALFGNKVIQIFIELNPTINKLNEKASVLYGMPIYGKVVIGMRMRGEHILDSDTKYIDLDKKTLEKLICVRSDEESSKNITDTKSSEDIIKEKESELQSNKNNKITNFYTVLNENYNNYKKKNGTMFIKKSLENANFENSLNKITLEKLNTK